MLFERPGKVGLISIGEPYFDVPSAQSHLDATRAALGHEYALAGPAEVITDPAGFEQALAGLQAARPDALLLQIGTFPDGEHPARLAEALRVPVIVHSLPEPDLAHGVALNSLCGANLASFTLHALEHPYTTVHGDARSPATALLLRAHLDAALALAGLHRLRVGMIGFRAPGFYPCAFDELLLRRVLGVAIDHIGLNEMTAALQMAAPRPAPGHAFPTIEGGTLSGEAVAAMERYYGAFTSLLERSGHQVIAIKDWPELFDVDSPGGFWPALGWAADDGYAIAPEGDVNGAVTMALLGGLAGSPPFFADICAWDDQDSTLALWHYGAPPSLARREEEIRYGSEGREVEFTLRPGPATIARVGLCRGSLRMLAIGVEITQARVRLRRAGARARTLLTPAGAVVRRMLEDGWEHHVCLVHGDVLEQLRAIARLAGMSITEL